MFSCIALAESADDSLLDFLNIGKIAAWAIAVQVALRGVAEALTRIAKLTSTGTDDEIAGWISQAAWLLGTLLGKFGYSVPKLVVEEEIKKAK
jgi:hypothetical protein